jgi:hypothetical protein
VNHPMETDNSPVGPYGTLAFSSSFTRNLRTASLEIPVLLPYDSGTFHGGKLAFFGHTTGDGWEQNSAHHTDE